MSNSLTLKFAHPQISLYFQLLKNKLGNYVLGLLIKQCPELEHIHQKYLNIKNTFQLAASIKYSKSPSPINKITPIL